MLSITILPFSGPAPRVEETMTAIRKGDSYNLKVFPLTPNLCRPSQKGFTAKSYWLQGFPINHWYYTI